MASAPARGMGGLFKKAWNEIPEVVGSSFMGLIGATLAVIGTVGYYSKDGDNRRYKLTYIVYRDDDPRAENIRQD